MTTGTSTRRLRIPVRLVNGFWECTLGGGIPLGEGTEGELLVTRKSIKDKAFLDRMERPGRHKVLDEGTPLLVCLTIKPSHPPTDDLKPFLKPYDNYRGIIATELLDLWNPADLHFVEVKLAGPNDKQGRLFGTDKGGLWLMTQGVEAVGLASTTVLLPEKISPAPVASLNHAFTRLSEAYETWRISHTGNIYTRVLYQERNGRWYPLDCLRDAALDKQEQEIAKGLWDDFLAKMTASPHRR